ACWPRPSCSSWSVCSRSADRADGSLRLPGGPGTQPVARDPRAIMGAVGVAMKAWRSIGHSAIVAALAAAVALLVDLIPSQSRAAAPVALIELDGAITPITVRLLDAAIDRARADRAQALIVELNTPGGLERSMRTMVQSILKSEVPVIVYVAPPGARAASAGVFLTIAAHVAAMAPATNIGAAHPVSMGGQMDKEMTRKVENDAAAFARTIAAERGRNVDWAERAVRSSVSATEREAVKLKIVDFVA